MATLCVTTISSRSDHGASPDALPKGTDGGQEKHGSVRMNEKIQYRMSILFIRLSLELKKGQLRSLPRRRKFQR